MTEIERGNPNQENFKPQEATPKTPYKEQIKSMTEGSRIWDYLSYDEKGELWINNLRIVDAIDHVARRDSEGAPVEIVDTTIIGRRCSEWRDLTTSVAQSVGFEGGFEYFYASKANRTSEVVNSVLRANWNIETSSKQDLDDLHFLSENDLFDKDSTRIICNGFKLPPQTLVHNVEAEKNGSTIIFEVGQGDSPAVESDSYAEKIIRLKKDGFNIMPILDTGELEYFSSEAENNGLKMDVGIRIKFGKVSNDAELASHVSRFGMEWEDARKAADTIDTDPNLNLTMLHAMVGAAETIEISKFAEHLKFAVDKFYALKADHADLSELNIGGGIPPMSESYDHKALLEDVLSYAVVKSGETGLPQPKIVFELGSFVAAEAGFYVFDIVQEKGNWALVDGSLIEAIPDMLLIGKEFQIMAVNNANNDYREVRLGDMTCDSDGRYPTKANDEKRVLLPTGEKLNYVVVLGVGAYQEQLAGVRGGHHCGLLEAAEVIVEKRADGNTYARVEPRQTLLDSQKIFGYSALQVEHLKKTK